MPTYPFLDTGLGEAILAAPALEPLKAGSRTNRMTTTSRTEKTHPRCRACAKATVKRCSPWSWQPAAVYQHDHPRVAPWKLRQPRPSAARSSEEVAWRTSVAHHLESPRSRANLRAERLLPSRAALETDVVLHPRLTIGRPPTGRGPPRCSRRSNQSPSGPTWTGASPAMCSARLPTGSCARRGGVTLAPARDRPAYVLNRQLLELAHLYQADLSGQVARGRRARNSSRLIAHLNRCPRMPRDTSNVAIRLTSPTKRRLKALNVAFAIRTLSERLARHGV